MKRASKNDLLTVSGHISDRHSGELEREIYIEP
jgi:hypothetical protein